MYASLEAVLRDLNQFSDATIYLCSASVGADEYGWAVVVNGKARAFVDDDIAEKLIVDRNVPIKTLQEVVE
jgi:hypothetical protein